jgi:hypothetical protein
VWAEKPEPSWKLWQARAADLDRDEGWEGLRYFSPAGGRGERRLRYFSHSSSGASVHPPRQAADYDHHDELDPEGPEASGSAGPRSRCHGAAQPAPRT